MVLLGVRAAERERTSCGSCSSGEKQSAFYRMVASHWEVAASFVNNGGIDEKLFPEGNTEHLVVFAKLQPFLAEVREAIGEPDYLHTLSGSC